ncbi:hypothetical protein EDD17DRAFT_1627818 [Pisolithus thermaeus]|nr:hypothetical protein EV401DRAFT_2000897 [Pisolithus croceorrhizus]KAI6156175.1 hypothetical protein EDD17DRAFT_1627818 [Pisolithus thermaeus]
MTAWCFCATGLVLVLVLVLRVDGIFPSRILYVQGVIMLDIGVGLWSWPSEHDVNPKR